MQIFLVVIDSTTSSRNVNENTREGTMNTRNFSLAKGIQNFYFIKAPDAESAKGMVVATFRAKPTVMRDVQRCITATPLNAITKLLTERQNTWSYIPIGGVRAPGQQGVNNTLQQIDKMNRLGQEQEISHRDWQPPRPVTYDAQEVSKEELRKVALTEDDRKVVSSVPAAATAPANMTPEMQVMWQQMQAMMAAMTGAVSPEPVVDMRKHDPRDDSALAARIRANASSGPKVEYVDDEVIPSSPNKPPAEGWDDDLKSVE